jgi:hypothetical protein
VFANYRVLGVGVQALKLVVTVVTIAVLNADRLELLEGYRYLEHDKGAKRHDEGQRDGPIGCRGICVPRVERRHHTS